MKILLPLPPLGMMCGKVSYSEDLSNLGEAEELRRYSKYQVIEYLKLWKTREILNMLMFRNFIFDAHKQEYTHSS